MKNPVSLEEAKRLANNANVLIRPINDDDDNRDLSLYAFKIVNNRLVDDKGREEDELNWVGHKFVIESRDETPPEQRKFVAHHYEICSSPSLSDLEKQVARLLGRGAKPIGGVAVSYGTDGLPVVMQAMAVPILRNEQKPIEF